MLYSDSLEFYKSVAKTHPILSREEEQDLLKRVKKGDNQARDLLVKHNLGLIIHLSKKHDGKGVALEDLVQEGMAGFVHAIDMFDMNQSVKLATYAIWWINANIFKYLSMNRAIVKMPHTRKGEGPISVPRSVSMSSPIGDNEDGEYLELFADESPLADEVLEELSHNQAIKAITDKTRFKKTKSKVCRAIVKERLMADEPLTLRELGGKYGVSRERVRQLETIVKDKLRKRLIDFAA
jgi:hypothetical protein